MSSILEAIIAAPPGSQWATDPSWREFVATGDESWLARLAAVTEFSWAVGSIVEAIPDPQEMDVHGERFLRAAIAAAHPSVLGPWVNASVMRTSGDYDDRFTQCFELLERLGCSMPWLAAQMAEGVTGFTAVDGGATPLSRLLLRMDDAPLRNLVIKVTTPAEYWVVNAGEVRTTALARLFAINAPDQWRRVLDSFVAPGGWQQHLRASVWVASLESAPREFLEPSAAAFELLTDLEHRLALGAKLFEIEPARFGQGMESVSREAIESLDPGALAAAWRQARESANWLLTHRGVAALPVVAKYIAMGPSRDNWRNKGMGDFKIPVLDHAIETLGRDAIPLLDAAFETEQPHVQRRALEHWIAIRTPADTEIIAARIRHLLSVSDSATVTRTMRIAVASGVEEVEEDLWALLAHKTRSVREAAANAMATLGDSRLRKTAELWKARRADTRNAAVTWLRALGTPGAIAALEARLDVEAADNVRDAILLALESSGGARKADPVALRARIDKTLAKVDGPPVPWLDHTKLPVAKLTDGSVLDANTLLYLLYRQSRVKEMRADIEARPLFAQIDRRTSGDLGLALLHAYLASEMDADDRWVMTFSALVGDDRIAPIIVRQVKTWADSSRGKLAEYAVQALVLLGTDVALVAVDSIAIRYQLKYKNIGKVAGDAFAHAAAARGVTVEELGDIVVPWLGFEPGQPRIVDTGKSQLQARIDSDFKLTFYDVATKKKVAKLPSGTSPQVQAEFKDVATALKDAAKAQLLRMEALLVRQFRWPAARWKELFLQHPLLAPFAQRLVWGAYDASGALLATFRALEDRSLTDMDDESYAIPADASLGIVHPLELSPDARQRWVTHFADYDVVPPFAQLERPVVLVADNQRATTMGSNFAGTILNAMTFKGRAERLGWTRWWPGDAGSISHYQKSFPTAGVDAFVETHDMFVTVAMTAEMALGNCLFVRLATVRTDAENSDEPGGAGDRRVMAFGDVPAVVFSEAMGDLATIAGTLTI